MNSLLGIFITMPHMVFWVIGGLLLIVELLVTTGYALWGGIVAVVVGMLAWLCPYLPMLLSWIVFFIFTLLSAYIWWRWIQKHNRSLGYKRLNDPPRSFLGLSTVVTTEIVNGFGRIKVRDSTWIAACNCDLPVGTQVRIIDVNGIVMIVIPVQE